MLARLEWMTLQPNVILDVGCRAGDTAVSLQQRYPQASVLAVDHAELMLAAAPATLLRVCASAQQLPLANQSVDLIFANFVLPWQADLQQTIQEWKRVLRPEGILIFTALGPDSFKEWSATLKAVQIPWQMDMHDIGDSLIENGFADPVLDVDYCTTSYQSAELFVAELVASEICRSDLDVSMLPPAQDDRWETTYEIVYGHAFAPAHSDAFPAKDGIARIPLSHLRRQLK